MAIRIPWNEYEQAILLRALIDVLDRKTDRKQAVIKVSGALRKLAKNQGLTIDDKFRNENGISLQMGKLEYVFTQNKSGLKVETGWYFEIVRIYKKEPGRYEQLLQEADQMLIPGGTEKPSFSEWLKQNKAEQSSQILMSLNMVNVLLQKDRIIRSNIAKIQDKEEIEAIIGQINTNKVSSIHSGSRKKYVDALKAYQEYLSFLTECEDNVNTDADEISNQDVAVVMEVSGSEQRGQQIERISFYEWMVRIQGLAEKSGRSYDSAINTADTFVKEHHIGNEILRETSDVKAVSETIVALFQNEEFIEINKRQHNRFRAALRKYQQYLSGDYAANTEAENNAYSVEDEFENVDFTLYKEDEYSPERLKPYADVLKEFFPKGYRLGSTLEMKKFRRYFEEANGENLEEESDIIEKMIQECGIVYDGRVHMPENMLDDSLRRRLFEYIEKCFSDGKAAIYFEALFCEFSEEFLDHHMYDADMLKAYIRYMCGDEYYIARSYLSKEKHAEVDPIEDVRTFLKEQGEPVETEKLCAVLSHIPEDKIRTILGTNGEFVRNSKGEYFHADAFFVSQEELENIAELMAEEIVANKFISGDELYEAVRRKYPYVYEKNSIFSQLGWREALKYKLSDRFSFVGNVISARDASFSMSDVFADFAKERRTFTMDELMAFAESMGTVVYFDSLYKNAVRVSKDRFVNRDDVRFQVKETDRILDKYCKGNYIPLADIKDFSIFPEASHPWNIFLLEQYVASFSDHYYIMHGGYNRKAVAGAMVKKEKAYSDFDDFITDVLAQGNVNLKKKEVLNYLADNRFIARRSYTNIESLMINAKARRNMKEK